MRAERPVGEPVSRGLALARRRAGHSPPVSAFLPTAAGSRPHGGPYPGDPTTGGTTMKLLRTLTALAALLALAAGFANAKGDKGGDISATLEAKEKMINDAFKNHDEKGFMALVDPNGWSVDPMGLSPVSGAVEMMKQVETK